MQKQKFKTIEFLKNENVIIIFVFAIVITLIFTTTYASNSKAPLGSLQTKILRVDEESYGNTEFDSTNLDFRPILDKNVNGNTDNVVHIQFNVGGSLENEVDNVIYDIALVDLEVDCELLSQYVKWQLLKNGELISNGSLDYKFDTIKNNRLVLTNIQQDLKEYSEDKTTYDHYDFYMWLSDSCQEEDIMMCLKAEDQSKLMNKKLNGKIEVELYADAKKELVRNPSDTLNTDTCIAEETISD